LDHQNNFVGILRMMSSAAKTFDIPATSSSFPHNYFDSSTKLLFSIQLKFSISQQNRVHFPCKRLINNSRFK